jgi:PAS domain S-box-containing protein
MPFFQFSNELLCLADRRGYFTKVNHAWTTTLGWSATELTSQPYTDFVHPDDRERTFAEAGRLLSPTYETVRFENRYVCRDGSYRWLAWYAKLEPKSDVIVAAARDVTEQKVQAESLRISEERLRLVMEATNDAIWDIDLQSGTIWWNETYNMCFGRRPKETESSWDWWIEHIHPEDRQRVSSSLRALIEGSDVRWSAEYRYARTDGAYAHVLDRALVTRDADGRALRVLGAMQDITARKQAEADLRTQAETIRHLFYLQDKERKLISHEIHDGLAQLVVGALMQIEAAGAKQTASPAHLQQACDILHRAIAESRRLINDLRPMIIDERGIGDSIKHLAAEYGKSSTCRFEYSIHLERDQIEPLFDSVVFRIIQESVANAIKHGRATEVQIRVEQIGSRLEVEVRDNGGGFAVDKIPADRFGIRGIRERAKIFGGSAQVISSPDCGTTVQATLIIPDWHEPATQ